MNVNKILSADILDILFDGKNKQYGAYDLRKTYNKRLGTALLWSVCFILVLGFLATFGSSKKQKFLLETTPPIEMAEIEKKAPPLPELKKPIPPPAPPQNQIKFVLPKIVKDSLVDKIEEIEPDQMISNKTVKSDIKDVAVNDIITTPDIPPLIA